MFKPNLKQDEYNTITLNFKNFNSQITKIDLFW